MKQIYFIPNIITAFGLSCGLFVIFKVNMTEPGVGTYGLLYSSTLLLLLAAFADLIDGAVARAIKAESEFGVIFDSLADAISFGVAPSVLLLKSLSLEQGTGLSFFAAIGAMLYTICGVLRLVRYSVRVYELKAEKNPPASFGKNFVGLPIPAAAGAAVSLNLFFHSTFAKKWFGLSDITMAMILICVMIVLSYLMISKWKFPSLKTLRFRLPTFHLLLLTVIVAIFILYGIFYYFPLILVLGSVGYIITACILTIIRLIAGKKSKTLVDFEPEPEDKD
jgi:CDP-diacylglycerol--serine O-phosphatidyltransferase